jgi:hypothetical protein
MNDQVVPAMLLRRIAVRRLGNRLRDEQTCGAPPSTLRRARGSDSVSEPVARRPLRRPTSATAIPGIA